MLVYEVGYVFSFVLLELVPPSNVGYGNLKKKVGSGSAAAQLNIENKLGYSAGAVEPEPK